MTWLAKHFCNSFSVDNLHYNCYKSVLPIKSQEHMRPSIKKYHNIACEIVENFIIKEGSQSYITWYMNEHFLQFCV
mgnify:CR=1 FL=1